MRDYSIVRFRDGDIGIYVESDWAALRGWEEFANGLIEVFKTKEAALHFVREGEAEGYKFEGKEELGHRGFAARCTCAEGPCTHHKVGDRWRRTTSRSRGTVY